MSAPYFFNISSGEITFPVDFDILRPFPSGNLSSENIEWFDKKSLCVVLCSNGYPGVYAKKVKLNNVSDLEIENGQYVIHAGTKYENKELFATGGRVLNIVVTSNSFENSKNQALKILNKINWKEGFYRKDIGYKVTSV